MRGQQTRFALYGGVLVTLGIAGFLAGAFMGFVRALLLIDDAATRRVVEFVIWYSAMPVVFGAVFIAADLFFVVKFKRKFKQLRDDTMPSRHVTVALTAYNDEDSIAAAVRDFIKSPLVERVIVVSNNSIDRTEQEAIRAGAIVHNEPRQGYGACVVRALKEASSFTDTDLVVLCEGDMTFRAYDLEKLLAYTPHADVVNGTRIVDQLQESSTQVSTFVHYGNFAVAKLLELKYLGDVTLSDVGTTYKVIRTSALRGLIPELDPAINLEFNPYFIERCILHGLTVIECPITFHRRLGLSKGGNASNKIAFKVGLHMIVGILAGWRFVKSGH